MAEGARLESVYTATYRGFESPPHRHILRRARTKVRAFFACGTRWGMRTPNRGSTTGNASWTDRKPASGLPDKNAGSVLNNACVGPAGRGPGMGRVTASEASQSPSPPYFKKSSYACTGFFSHVAPQTSRGRQQCLSRATRPYPPGSPAKRSAAGRMPKNNKARASPALLTV